jgi:hypothetical protein
MSPADHAYRPGPVPSYVLTGGRTSPKTMLQPETLLVTAAHRPAPDGTATQKRDLLWLCRKQLGLAELAAHLELPMSVVRILAADLIDDGLLVARASTPPRETLERVLAGLRKL